MHVDNSSSVCTHLGERAFEEHFQDGRTEEGIPEEATVMSLPLTQHALYVFIF